MKISIITVCYNAEKTIEKTIKSVLNQGYKNIEYIIVDGNSTDNTMNIITNYRNEVDIIISENDNGIYDAINKGINASSGEIIGILNADDILFNNNIITKISQYYNKFLPLKYRKFVIEPIPYKYQDNLLKTKFIFNPYFIGYWATYKYYDLIKKQLIIDLKPINSNCLIEKKYIDLIKISPFL